ncbi:MAG: type II toxin-antitoxin system RelB/DinJ family antitoxin [Clostridia bacterium]|nr:type II toxin-antitoxin system RelB/DinJ family antitoxin [Clostridia bacterium]
MSKTAVVYARIDSELKDQAEAVLADLGVTPSSLIQMVYRQIVLTQGLPFEVRKPKTVIYADGLTDEDLAAIIAERLKSYKNDKEYTKEEFHRILEEKYGI